MTDTQPAPPEPPPRPGWLTSEFKMSLLATSAGLAMLFFGDHDARQLGMILVSTAVGGYTISRGMAKRG